MIVALPGLFSYLSCSAGNGCKSPGVSNFLNPWDLQHIIGEMRNDLVIK